MQLLRNLSLKRKLTFINVLSTALALFVACALFMTFDVLSFKTGMVRDATMDADLVGANSTAAVSFGDEKGAGEILASLRADPHIRSAGLYTPDGKLFASYRSPIANRSVPETIASPGHQFVDGRLELVRAVELNGQKICSIFVRSDLDELYRRMKLYAVILAVVFFASLGAAVAVARRLQRQITEPVLHLARTAREVSAGKNYTLRAVKICDDELGQLTDDFNDMLEEIRGRDAELKAHQDHLEEQVSRRTHELRELNTHLVSAKDVAESANRAKSAFLANMSHEIRTPMTAILGFADLLLEPNQGMSQRLNCVQTIRRNSEHLLGIINDVLDISKIEAGKMTVERVACSPAQVVTEVASLMRVKASEKDLLLNVSFNGPIPKTISSDPMRLRQILINLVGNAVKFTPKGDIELRVFRDAQRSDVIHFAVRDSGVGIAPQQQAQLFQPFTQADVSTTRRFGGTGLGLTISKRLSEALGGGIEISSRVGEGSTFDLTVNTGPLEGVGMYEGLEESTFSAAEPVMPAMVTPDRVRGRILLAEDGPDNQRLISYHLRKAGAEVVIAENGALAVQMALAAVGEGKPFGMIFMDMQMPELDGYGATVKLRTGGYATPIVALTAHAMASDREKCLRAGCTDYLTKPVDRLILVGMAAKYLAMSAAAQTTDLATQAVESLPGQILDLQRQLDEQSLIQIEQAVQEKPGH